MSALSREIDELRACLDRIRGMLEKLIVRGLRACGAEELDKEQMGEIFIKYKGAEAGEVDWRPTETLPEDYYAV